MQGAARDGRSGTVRIRAPRVNDKRIEEETGERKRFSSKILPAYARRSPKMTACSRSYLRGLSTGDFGPGLRDLLGEDASGLSPSSIQRLTERWQAEHAMFGQRGRRFHRYAYWFIDGIHTRVRLGSDDRLCLLVIIGVREDGVKKLLAVEHGYRESAESRASVMREHRHRGINEPKLVVGDGALGIWAALRDVFLGARRQACWVHNIARVLDAVHKRLQPRASSCCTRSWRPRPAETRSVRWSGSATSSTPSSEGGGEARPRLGAPDRVLRLPRRALAHPQNSNAIESSFATVRFRTRVTEGRRVEESCARDGVQAAGRRRETLAPVQRPPAHSRRTRRREVHPNER
jgi:transposase-like protein